MAENLDIIVAVKDEATAKIESINKGMEEMGKESEATANSLSNLALNTALWNQALELAVDVAKKIASAIYDFGVTAIDAARESAIEQERFNAVLEATGGIAGVTAESAMDFANAMSMVTNYTDEEILSAESLILTFTNIGKDIFPQATQAAMDMASILGTDLSSAAWAVGKALESPTNATMALKSAGVMLTDQEKDEIETMVELGDVTGAQTKILELLTNKYGDGAKNMASSSKIAKNAIDNMYESIGNLLLPSVNLVNEAFIDNASALSSVFYTSEGELRPEVGRLSYEISVLTTEVLNAVPSVSSLATFLGSFAYAAIKAAQGAMTFLVTAREITQLTAGTLGTVVGGTIEAIRSDSVTLGDVAHAASESVKGDFQDIADSFSTWNSTAEDIITEANEAAAAIGGVGSSYGGYSSDASGASEKTKDLSTDLSDLEKGFVDLQKTGTDKMEDLNDSFSSAMADIEESIADVSAEMAELTAQFQEETQSQNEDLAAAIVESEEKQTSLAADIAEQQALINEEMAKSAEDKDQDVIDSAVETMAELQAELDAEVAAYTANAQMIEALSNEVSAVRQYNSMTDLEQAVSNFYEERQASIDAYEEEMLQLADKKLAYEEARVKIELITQTMWDNITKTQNSANTAYQLFLDTRAAATQAFVDTTKAQIDALNEAYASINTSKVSTTGYAGGGVVYASNGWEAKGTDTVPAMLTPGERVLTVAQNREYESTMRGGGITININNPMVLDDADIVAKIGDPIIRELMNHSFAN